MPKNIIYLKESIFDSDIYSSDYDDMSDIAQQSEDFYKNNIIKELIPKYAEKIVNLLFSTKREHILKKYFGQKEYISYFKTSTWVVKFTNLLDDENDHTDEEFEYCLFADVPSSPNKEFSESYQLRTFFKSLLIQLLTHSKTIEYDYIVDNEAFSIISNTYNYMYYGYGLADVIDLLYHTDGLGCDMNYEFIKNICIFLLNAATELNQINEDEVEQILNSIDWQNSTIHFHMDCKYFSLEESIDIDIDDTRIEILSTNIEKYMKYFDFSFWEGLFDDNTVILYLESNDWNRLTYSKLFSKIDNLLKFLKTINYTSKKLLVFFMYAFFSNEVYIKNMVSRVKKNIRQKYPDCPTLTIKIYDD